MSNKGLDLPQPELSQHHHAGDVQAIPGGQITYLAPLPLSTGHPPLDMSKAVSELNNTWLDFGGGWPSVAVWQTITGGVCTIFLFCALVFPAISFALLPANMAIEVYGGFFWAGVIGSPVIFIISYLGYYSGMKRLKNSIPVRFHRQRREVCFTLTDTQEAVIVPWESLMAWVVEARGATQYGVQ
ncbi:MAG: hypothetical protein ACRC3F_19755, partial [Billgrantia desiderata]